MDTDEILGRIFNKLDTYDNRLNTTCTSITEIKTTLTNFIDSVEKKEKENITRLENKFKYVTAVFGSIASISVIFALVRSIV